MSYFLSQTDHRSTLKLSNNKRYELFLKKAAQYGEIWSLANEEGWVTIRSEEGENCLPIWPHPDYAKEWCNGEWNDCQPKAIELDVWLERWTTGLEQDETLLVVFPNLKEEALLVDPYELDESLRDALRQSDTNSQ